MVVIVVIYFLPFQKSTIECIIRACLQYLVQTCTKEKFYAPFFFLETVYRKQFYHLTRMHSKKYIVVELTLIP